MVTEERALTIRESDMSLSMVTTADEQRERMAELQEFVANYLQEGDDYGVIPGTEKPTLYKPGAEKLCDVYGLQRMVSVTNRVEDWEAGFFHYEVQADLVSMRTGLTIAQGVGSCNSREERYRYRNDQRRCPSCGATAIIKGKAEFGGGWLCWAKKDGCGAKFADNAPEIVNQSVGKIENPEPYTLVNTILKMAKKRALVDAVLSATRSSGLFTQDVEDFVDGEYREVAKPVSGVPERDVDADRVTYMKPPANTSAADEKTAWAALYASGRDYGITTQVQMHEYFNVPPEKGALQQYAKDKARLHKTTVAEALHTMRLELPERVARKKELDDLLRAGDAAQRVLDQDLTAEQVSFAGEVPPAE